MSVNLGTIFAEARINTQGYRQGTQEIASLSRAIGASIASIGTTSIGFALGGAISGIVSSIGEIPKALVQANASVEKDTLSMAAGFDTAANQIKTTWEESQQFVSQSTEKETVKVADVVKSVQRAYEDATVAAADFARQVAGAQANASRAIAQVQQRAADFAADIATTQARRSADSVKSAEKHAQTVQQIENELAEAIDAARKKSAAAMRAADVDYGKSVASIAQSVRKLNDEFSRSQIDRLRDLKKAQAEVAKESQKSAQQLAESISAAATASTARARAEILSLGQQLTALRNSELQQALSHAQQLEDLAARELAALTPEQRSALAQEKVRLQSLQGLQQQELANRRNTIKQTSQENVNAADEESARAIEAAQRRVDEEVRLINERNAALQDAYNQDTENAQRAYDEQLEARRKQLRDAEIARGEAQAAAAAAEAAEIAAAKKAAKEKLEALQKAQKEEAAARERAVADERTRIEREKRDRAQAIEDIQRGLTESLDAIGRQRERSLTELERALSDMAKRQTDAERELNQAREEAMQKLASRQSEFAEAFSAPWIAQANAINDKFKLPFQFTLTTNGLEKAEQMVEFSEKAAEQLPLSATEIREAMTRMIQTGIDPTLDKLRTLSAFSLKPTVTGGIRQLVDAFGSLASGQIGEGVQRLREAGIPLERIAGLKFDKGQLVTPLQDAMKIIFQALGPEAENIIGRFQGSFALMVSNIGDAKDRLVRIIGKGLFDITKAELKNFTDFITANKDDIEAKARALGEAIGQFVRFIVDRFKEFTAPKNLDAFRNLLDQIGAIKDQVVRIVQDIFDALTKIRFPETAKGADELASAIDKLNKSQFGDLEQQLADMGVQFFDVFESGDDVDTMRKKLTDFFNTRPTEGAGGLAGALDGASDALGKIAKMLAEVDTSKFQEDFMAIRTSMVNVGDLAGNLNQLFGLMADIFRDAGAGFSMFGDIIHKSLILIREQLLVDLEMMRPWHEAFASAFADIGEMFNKFGTFVNEKLTDIVQTIVTLADRIKDGANFLDLAEFFAVQWSKVVAGAIDALSKLPDAIMEILHRIHGSGVLDDWLNDLITFIPDQLSKIFDAIGGLGQGAVDALMGALSGTQELLATFATNILEATEAALDTIISLARKARDAVASAAAGIGGAIGGAAGAIGGAISGAAGAVGGGGIAPALVTSGAQANAALGNLAQSAQELSGVMSSIAFPGTMGGRFNPGVGTSATGSGFVGIGEDLVFGVARAFDQWQRSGQRSQRPDQFGFVDPRGAAIENALDSIAGGGVRLGVDVHHNTFNENGIEFVSMVSARLMDSVSRRARR